MTATRNPGTAPVLQAFQNLAHLPPAERTEQIMLRLQHIWDEAQGKSYTNKHGDEVPMPDGNLQLKVIQAVAVLQGMTGPQAEADAKTVAEMSDDDLIREATKRLPPHQIAALADQLIADREQQLANRTTIQTTGETQHETEKPKQRRRDPK